MKKNNLPGTIGPLEKGQEKEATIRNSNNVRPRNASVIRTGFVYQKKLFPTEDGTPQGSIVSLILANMTLDGIERIIKERYWTNKKGTINRNYNNHKVHYTRYADDFIVTADSREILIEIKQMITEHLTRRGLMLSEEKTLITHIDEGFDFLG